MTVQEALVGQIQISKVTLNGFKGIFDYNSGTMKNTQIQVVLKPSIDWWYGVCVDYLIDTYCVSDSGNEPLGSIDTGWSNLGDVSINGGKLSLDIAQTAFGPFVMTPSIGGENQGMTASSVQTAEVNMEDTRMSTGLPSVLGLDLPVPNPLGPQSVNVKRTQVARFQTEGIKVPPIAFKDIQAQDVKIDKAVSAGFEVSSTFTKSTDWADLGYVGFRLRVDITSRIKASNITMNGLSGDVQVQSALASGFDMSLTLNKVELKGLRINDFQIPTILVEV